MSKTLVAYFSATGTTKRVARAVADAAGADLVEIAPATPYTAADLNWHDGSSRSTLEGKDPAARPELASAPGDLTGYDTILLGFPIWWYVAPRIVDTWVVAANLAGKRVVTWATSGGSAMGGTTAELKKLAPEATWVDGRVLRGTADAASWVSSL